MVSDGEILISTFLNQWETSMPTDHGDGGDYMLSQSSVEPARLYFLNAF